MLAYAKKYFSRLSVEDVVALAEATSDYDIQDEILLSFAKSQGTRLKVRDLRTLADAGYGIDDEIDELIDQR